MTELHFLMIMIFKYPFITLFIFTFALQQQGSRGQEFENIRFENISVNEGLSQSTGRVILQDQKGFIWIGTQDGLNKYDGYSFKVYNNNPLDSNSLADNFINHMCEDHNGIIWIGYNGGGLDRFDPSTEMFTHFNHVPGDPSSLSDDIVLHIYEDREGILWIGTNNGICIKEPASGAFRRISLQPENEPVVTCFYEDSGHRFWIGTRGAGLILFDRDTEQPIELYTHNPDANSISGNTISCIMEDGYGDFWIGTGGSGLNRFDRAGNEFHWYMNRPDDPKSLSTNNVFDILETQVREKTLWIGTQNGGLNRYVRKEDAFVSYVNDPNDPFSISNNIVFDLASSSDGTLWVGTGGGGINKVSLRTPKFRHYKYPGNILANFIWKIFQDDQKRVWIGSQGFGFYYFDRESEQYHRFTIDQSRPEESQNFIVWSALMTADQTLWIGTSVNGVFRINQQQGIWRNYRADPEDSGSIGSNNVRVVFEASDGTIWIGTNGAGLYRFHHESETFTQYTHIPGDTTSLSFNVVFSIQEDHEKNLWVGTYGGGLNRLDPETGRIQRFIHDPYDSTSISNNRIRCIFEDRDKRLWVGTDHGLNCLDKETGRFISYSTRDGLPNNVVYSVLPDRHGNFWLSTNRGLSRFNPDEMTFRNYDEEDGLQSNEFNTGAYYVSDSGEMFFGGINGFNIFHPDSIRENAYVPPVRITNLKLFNHSMEVGPDGPLLKDITDTDELVLSHQQNFLTFEFSAFNYINTQKNQYQYMLEGVDHDWVEAGERRFADYPGLRHGKYIFRVIGSNNDGTWNLEGDQLKITIRPPWWKTPMAYLIYTMVVLALIYAFIRLRTRRLVRLSDRLEKQVKERTMQIARQKEEIETQRDSLRELNATKDKLFRIIAHDLKNPMTALMSITQSLSMAYMQLDEKDKETAIRQVNKAAGDLHRLLDNLLQWTTAQSGKMQFHPETFDLHQIAQENLSLAEPLARKKKITVEADMPERCLVTADKNMIGTVFRNLLSNAIKFTPEGGSIALHIKEIRSDKDRSGYEISVADSGVGIPKDRLETLFQMENASSTRGTANESGTGLGLLLCYDFIKRNQGSLRAESKTGKGSRFIFTLASTKAP